jgi:hypothetical protein
LLETLYLREANPVTNTQSERRAIILMLGGFGAFVAILALLVLAAAV